jgi:hypothetical protein
MEGTIGAEIWGVEIWQLVFMLWNVARVFNGAMGRVAGFGLCG